MKKISIIGLGYVGLPLLLQIAKKKKVVGFDINKKRINQLLKGIDDYNEHTYQDIKKVKKNLILTSDNNMIKNSDLFIITVPTPVDNKNKPDLKFIINATEKVASLIKKNSIVVYESTVFPGCTEEICVPIIEKISKLKFNKDFFCGYSPERINVGDSKHKLQSITKIVSGSNSKTTKLLSNFFKTYVTKKIYSSESIKVAEAAKVIENTQRDINIALINEFSLILNKLKIDTYSVLKAAATKWNFVKYEPGLVGGHCVGVDPYYLAYKAKKNFYNPKMILAGREINESMSLHIANDLINQMKIKKIKIKKSKVLLLGYSFKENTSDSRNSKVRDMFNHLSKKGLNVKIFDPLVNKDSFDVSFKKNFVKNINVNNYFDAIILSVPHTKILKMGIKKILKTLKNKSVFFDLKQMFPKKYSDRSY